MTEIKSLRFGASLVLLFSAVGCVGEMGTADDSSYDELSTDESAAYEVVEDGGVGEVGGASEALVVTQAWPTANAYSWDGSWTPTFPVAGLFDNEYGDGHLLRGVATPILPPGKWDWSDPGNDLANWRNFERNIGRFNKSVDSSGRQYGWTLVGNVPSAIPYTGPAAYFEGSPGVDWLNLGINGSISSFSAGNLGDGPDVLMFKKSYSLDYRTGSSTSGNLRDNDLVVAGCGVNAPGVYDVLTTTIHTGPGRDWAFVRDISRAAVDLGNGNGGQTSALDTRDVNDLLVLRGNTHDFRVFGGYGNDTTVWYVDENVQTTGWLGPNFFGGGGSDGALWGDPGIDRLVLAVPTSTVVVGGGSTPAGGVRFRATTGRFIDDSPTTGDPNARYCIECGVGPGGRKTIILEYRSANGKILTGYFYLTAFEEVQIGIGAAARVYRIDDVNGTLVLDTSRNIYVPPTLPTSYCAG